MKKPSLEWKSEAYLYSRDYCDAYSSSDGWLEEKEYVFLKANQLPDRWKGRKSYSIFELGFGTGLNFILSWELWKQNSSKDSVLHYSAVEKAPLDKEVIYSVFANYKHLQHLVDEFLRVYHIEEEGIYRFFFPKDRIYLNLLVGDISEMLPMFCGQVDLWFLDGFSPSKNPEMWSDEVFYWIAKKSYNGASLSTYSAASSVKQSLEKYGFQVQKINGFGKKREMLVGTFDSQKTYKEEHYTKLARLASKLEQPWHKIPVLKTISNKPTAIVLGAGLAGTSIARNLAKRGWIVQVVEKENSPASQASGNPFGFVSPILTKEKIPLVRFVLSAFSHFLTHTKELQLSGNSIQIFKTGLLKLIPNQTELYEFQTLLQDSNISESNVCIFDSQKTSEISGTKLYSGGIFFPQACFVSPSEICKANLNHSNIRQIYGSEVAKIEYSSNTWIAYNSINQTVTEGDIIILANSYNCLKLEQTSWLPLRKMRGQIAYLPRNTVLEKLKTILYQDCYVLPETNGFHVIGSTYNPYDNDLHFKPEQNLILTQKVQNIFPEIQPTDDLQGRVGFRTVSKDHFPLIGPIPERESFLKDYKELWKGKPNNAYPDGKYIPGLYLSVGHGSRGLIYSHLGAEILGDMICNSPTALGKDLVDCVAPARFLIRDLISRKLIGNQI
ncbi:MAG: bifunctional tRNA (5-methylaminomethyl-2-thiouridine)(34)-methyltransferase MnmD/FAD-dependent 5-carboxymethylaminomethyl-2-thiouridine(34) oxidoreductase MnmC [Leptospiraceae bacterium]|nr:bifunctional tRNA (5-methylaminomethyl-2-thiouridine)(34)-methyltransferase MnmD/FAD-dependent 5-carboxymethylaminomethyl-2-thiouridine(34) oxidoreductase MnmC [Leptospiraceae bacterium]